jgi:hypothetical protein
MKTIYTPDFSILDLILPEKYKSFASVKHSWYIYRFDIPFEEVLSHGRENFEFLEITPSYVYNYFYPEHLKCDRIRYSVTDSKEVFIVPHFHFYSFVEDVLRDTIQKHGKIVGSKNKEFLYESFRYGTVK